MGGVRDSEMTEMLTHRSNGAIFLWNLSASFSWVLILLGLYNFPDVHAILMVTSPANVLQVDTPSV